MHLTAIALTVALAQGSEVKSSAVFRALGRGEVESVIARLAADKELLDATETSWDQRLLHRAVAMDLEPVVIELLERGAALEARDRGGCTALHDARSASVAARLLAAGADPSARDESGDTPLRRAVGRSALDDGAQADALIAAGVPLDLESAVRLGRIEWVRGELERSEARRREAIIDAHVLLAAASAGSYALVDDLIDIGACVQGYVTVRDALDDYFETPLTGAVRGGHCDVARRLLDAGASAKGDCGWFERGGLQGWNGDDGDLLCRAIADDNVELVRLLVAHGADVQSGPAVSGRESKRVDERGLFSEPRSKRCVTPLARAAWRGSLEIVEALLAGGADLNRPSLGALPIFHAALAGHDALALELLARGATLDAWSAAVLGLEAELDRFLALDPGLVEQSEPSTNSNLLLLAIERDRRDVLEVLVHRGARLDGKQVGLWWPGMTRYAFTQGILMDGYPPGPQACTPLAYAIVTERFEFALQLIDHGAPVDPGARAKALASFAPEATAFLRELEARGHLEPRTRAEGRQWLGTVALEPIDESLARERILLLLEAGCTDSRENPVAHTLASNLSYGNLVSRGRVLHDLGFEMDFVHRVQYGIGGEIPRRAELARLRRTAPANYDWVQSMYVPAARLGHVELVVELAESNETLRPADHFEAALAAARQGRVDVVSALIGLGAPLVERGPEETRALLYAAAEGNDAELIDWLLQHGAELELADHEGCTALHVAADAHAERAVGALIAAGADVHARDDYGNTPLHAAASAWPRKRFETTRKHAQGVMERLIAAGADRAARSYYGYSPVEALRHRPGVEWEPPVSPELVQTLQPPR